MKRKMLSLLVLIIFYIYEGVRHFLFPHSYYAIIPPYIPFHSVINYIAGALEIVFAIMLIFPSTRKIAATGIIVLLVVYIPTHIYMIEMQPGVWQLWARLFIGQPFLIVWAWWHREDRENIKGILE